MPTLAEAFGYRRRAEKRLREDVGRDIISYVAAHSDANDVLVLLTVIDQDHEVFLKALER